MIIMQRCLLSIFFLWSVSLSGAAREQNLIELGEKSNQSIKFNEESADGLFTHNDDGETKQAKSSAVVPLLPNIIYLKKDSCDVPASSEDVVLGINSIVPIQSSTIGSKSKNSCYERAVSRLNDKRIAFSNSFSEKDIPYVVGPILIMSCPFVYSLPCYEAYSVYPDHMRDNMQRVMVAEFGLAHTLLSLGTHYLSRSNVWKRGSLSVASKMKVAGALCVSIGAPLSLSGVSWNYSRHLIAILRKPYTFEEDAISRIECYASNTRLACFAGAGLSSFGGTLWLAGKGIETMQRLCNRSELSDCINQGDEGNVDGVAVLSLKKPAHPPHIIPQPILIGALSIGCGVLARYFEVPPYQAACFKENFYSFYGGPSTYKGVLGYMGASEYSTAFMQLGAWTSLVYGAYRYTKDAMNSTSTADDVRRIKKELPEFLPLSRDLCSLIAGYIEKEELSVASKVKIFGVWCASTGIPLTFSAIPSHYSQVLTDLYCAERYDHCLRNNKGTAEAILQRGNISKKACVGGIVLTTVGMTLWLAGKTMENISSRTKQKFSAWCQWLLTRRVPNVW